MNTINSQPVRPEISDSIAPVSRILIRRPPSGLLLVLFLLATYASSLPGNATSTDSGPKKQTETSLKASEKSITVTAKVTLTATVSPSEATGDVTFYLGKKEIGTSPVIAGVAKLKTTTLPLGEDEITAVYRGSKEYLGSKSKAVTIHVKSGGSCDCRTH